MMPCFHAAVIAGPASFILSLSKGGETASPPFGKLRVRACGAAIHPMIFPVADPFEPSGMLLFRLRKG